MQSLGGQREEWALEASSRAADLGGGQLEQPRQWQWLGTLWAGLSLSSWDCPDPPRSAQIRPDPPRSAKSAEERRGSGSGTGEGHAALWPLVISMLRRGSG